VTIWRLITIEELRNLGDEQIIQKVNEALVPPGAGPISLMQPADVVAAQFYMSELDRRENRRANTERDRIDTQRRRVDLLLELLIVALIGVEIVLSILAQRQQSRDAAQELRAFSDMQVVLSNLRDTSKATGGWPTLPH
jgi:hypothetical protein